VERRFPGERALLRDLLRDGLIERQAVETGAGARAPVVRMARVADGVDVAVALAGPLGRAKKQLALLERLAAEGPQPVAALGGASESLRQLVARGLAVVFEQALETGGRANEALADGEAAPPEPTPEQEAALAVIAESIRARRGDRFLLHGVTGSGKTEVYLRAIAETLAVGRQALVLVPEITLTHQLVARLSARFGTRVAVLHSQLRPGERIAEWRSLLGGHTRIAVGARSALFAPLDDLGLIVMDEEHEPAYKNEEGFRYHARDLAARRAADSGCPLVLGSATPALETRYAAERGELRRLSLPHRIGGRPLPAVEVVDLGVERALLPRGRRLVLSRVLHAAIAETLADSAAGTARSRSSTTLAITSSAATTASTRSIRPRPVRNAVHPTPRCSGSARNASKKTCGGAFPPRASRGSIATPPHVAAKRSACSRRSRRAPSTSSSAHRWSRRDTTSRASAWWAWWRPTRACTSRTSVRPSAPSSC
jgi:primosomal protein N' (replication factor Y)